MVKVKICGITNLKDARNAAEAGAEALGFVFYKKSPRYINPRKAGAIIKSLPKNIFKIGIFVNAKEENIRRIAKFCRLDMLQLHGEESPEFCAKFKKSYGIIKAFCVKKTGINLTDVLKYKTSAYLFDTFIAARPGGTGRSFSWRLLRAVRDNLKKTIFLSGGLDSKNVKGAIKILNPDWVDVSSSVEAVPGRKDYKKIKKFIEEVRRINGLFIK